MELITVIFFLFLIPLLTPFIILKCLSFYLKRRHSITLSVGKCGLISFRAIEITFPNNLPSTSTNNQDEDGYDRRYDDDDDDHQETTTNSFITQQTTTIKIDSLKFSSLISFRNITIEVPIENGGHLPIKIGNFELPFDKIRHYKKNYNVTIYDIAIILENFSYKIAKLTLDRSVDIQTKLDVQLDLVEFNNLSISRPQSPTTRSPLSSKIDENIKSNQDQSDLLKHKILSIEQLHARFVSGGENNKSLTINFNGDCFLQWNIEFHKNILQLISAINWQIQARRKSNTDNQYDDGLSSTGTHKSDPHKSNPKERRHISSSHNSRQVLIVESNLNGCLNIGAMISETGTFFIKTQSLKLNSSFPGTKTIQSDLITFIFDNRDILSCTSASLSHIPIPGDIDSLDRKQNCCGIKLNDQINSLLCVKMDFVKLSFPYKYNFAEAFNQNLMGIVKWLKKYHKNSNRKLIKKSIDFDMSFKINKFLCEIEDDPFETKLRNNFTLLEDEYHEQLKRDQTLQDKINELKKTNLMLASSVVEELNKALAKKNSDIYIQRSKQLYSSEAKQTPLFTVMIEEADLKILADSSFHEHSDIKKIIKKLDDKGQMSDDICFTTLFCRIISANLKSADFSLRDFPMSMISTKDLTFKGTILGSEQTPVPRAKRDCLVYIGRNSPPEVVERSMTPLKIYHNVQLRCTTANYTHGPCWDPVLQQVSIAFDDIVAASSDPSPSLAWWDKMRLIFHGQAKLNCNQLSVVLHASNDPYNQTEMIEFTLSRAMVELSTGFIKTKGDFDVLLHTASKYDECRLIHLPNLDVTAVLEWNCLGNPNDHYSIMPCAPDKVPDYSSHNSHDSYRSIRSQSLNMTMNFETQFTSPTSSLNPDNMPSMLFFGSTIRWLENKKFIFVGPSKLTRRGKLFDNIKPKKPSFSRIFKDIRVTASLNRFQILYWSSVSKRHGIQMVSGDLTHSSEHNLRLVQNNSDGLKHRQLADWQTVYMNSALNNVDIWLYNLGFEDLDEFNEFNVQTNLKNRQYFLSFDRISYNKEAQIKNSDEIEDFYELSRDVLDSVSNDIQSIKSDDHVPNHRLVIHDLKAAWTKENRDVVVGIFDAFINSQQLKRNLSTEALKPIRIEPANQPASHPPNTLTNSSPPYRHQRHPSTTSLIITNTNTPVQSISKNRAVSMLQKLIADSENNPNVYTEETHSGVASETHLYGVEACQMDDVVDINCLIELVNSQVVLKGNETPGYVIVSAANTEIRQATHLPVWKNRTIFSKTTWTGSLKCMQYYATVDGQYQDNNEKSILTDKSNIQWLDPDNIDSRSVIIDYSDMVGSGHSVGGVVSPIVGRYGRSSSTESGPNQIELQRIISRCNCLFYYATHTEGVPENLQHLIPPLPDDDMFIEPWDKEVGVDSFTLTHQDLDISTNSQQYAMILDIINNLLLFVEPHKKTAFERLERMRFRFQLSVDEDQREPITRLQDQVRKYVAYLKRLERERYLVYRASIDDSMLPETTDHDYRLSLNTLSYEIQNVKEQLNSASEELAMMISCYKELQLGAHKAQKLQQQVSEHGTGALFANVIKRSEICFKSAKWRVTDSDGQLGLADIVLNNFLYSKVVKSDDSVEHTIELGHIHVLNLIPNQAFKDVLRPTELQANIPLDRQRALRIYCRELAPVAGIPVKEHLEVNVVPFTIEVTLQFFQKMVKFFFPDKDAPKEEKSKKGLDLSGEHRFGSKRRGKANNEKNSLNDNMSVVSSNEGGSNTGSSGYGTTSGSIKGSGLLNPGLSNTVRNNDDTISTISTATMNSVATVSSLNSNQRRGEEIEKMRERASKNHTFVYVKIPGIPIKVSYKGKKQKSVTDLKNMSLTLPTYEYHNLTWTWLDLLMAVKNDSKHTVIKQALKQKMKIRPSSIFSKSSNTDQLIPALEINAKEKSTTPVTDEDKARLLLGAYANVSKFSLASSNPSPNPSPSI